MDKAPPPGAGDSGFKSHTGAFWHKFQYCNLEGWWKALRDGLDCRRKRQSCDSILSECRLPWHVSLTVRVALLLVPVLQAPSTVVELPGSCC
eukprot:3896172-Amphidinium_carterae.1